jgi:hypothetical protein
MKHADSSQTPITPQLLAAAIVPMAASHVSGLQKSVEVTRSRLPSDRPPPNEQEWRWTFQELLVAHFCLVSLSIILKAFPKISDRNRYGERMIEFLRNYPDAESTLVSDTFDSEDFMREAVRWYLEGIPEVETSGEMQKLRRALSVESGNGLGEFTLKLQVRISRLLKIKGIHPEYLPRWIHNCSAIIAAAQTYAQWQPMLSER